MSMNGALIVMACHIWLDNICLIIVVIMNQTYQHISSVSYMPANLGMVIILKTAFPNGHH